MVSLMNPPIYGPVRDLGATQNLKTEELSAFLTRRSVWCGVSPGSPSIWSHRSIFFSLFRFGLSGGVPFWSFGLVGNTPGPPPGSPVSIALDRTDPEFWRLRRADLCLSPRVLAIPGEE